MAKLGQYKINTMTTEEVAEAVKNHLLQQDAKSMEDGICAYKGDNGLCCAAGIFMQDHEQIMEGLPWHVVVGDYNQGNRHVDLIADLQIVHDITPVEEWEGYFNSCWHTDSLKKAIEADATWVVDNKS